MVSHIADAGEGEDGGKSSEIAPGAVGTIKSSLGWKELVDCAET